MRLGEGGAFVAGAVLGGIGGGGLGYQAGYNQRDAELQPIIESMHNQLNVKDKQIAELQRRLDEKTAIPVISQIRNKLRGSQS